MNMEFRRSGDRRRRVLMDEARLEGRTTDEVATAASAPAVEKEPPALGYADAAKREQQLRLADLIPARPWSLLVVGLWLATLWTGLQAAYGYTQLDLWGVPPGVLDAFDLQRADSLPGWCATLQLAAIAVVALGIFSIRRHRLDDYRGRYRLWLWVAALSGFASLESLAGMRAVLIYGMECLTGTKPAWQILWWWIPVAAAFVACAVRTLLEVRRSRGAVIVVTLAVLGYATVLTDQLYPLLPTSVVRGMAISGAWLAAHALALFALVIYARFVLLEAQGLIQIAPRARRARQPRAPRAAKPRRSSRKEAKSAEPSAEPTPEPVTASQDAAPLSGKVGATIRAAAAPKETAGKTVAKPASPPPAAKPAATVAAKPAIADDEDDDQDAGQSLSRAERKRLKKEMRRQQRSAA